MAVSAQAWGPFGTAIADGSRQHKGSCKKLHGTLQNKSSLGKFLSPPPHSKAGFCLLHHSGERSPDGCWLGMGLGASAWSLNASSALRGRSWELENVKDLLDHLLRPQEGRRDCPPQVAGTEISAVAGFSWWSSGNSSRAQHFSLPEFETLWNFYLLLLVRAT